MPASMTAKAEPTGHVAPKVYTLRCPVYRQRSTGLYVAECIDLDLMVKVKKPNKAMRERGRGRSAAKMTFGPEGDQDGDKGVWMSIWVDDVDAVYQHCLSKGLEITWPPTDMPWNVREMHLRHPDGHVFRITQAR
jgi:hypothetical protein